MMDFVRLWKFSPTFAEEIPFSLSTDEQRSHGIDWLSIFVMILFVELLGVFLFFIGRSHCHSLTQLPRTLAASMFPESTATDKKEKTAAASIIGATAATSEDFPRTGTLATTLSRTHCDCHGPGSATSNASTRHSSGDTHLVGGGPGAGTEVNEKLFALHRDISFTYSCAAQDASLLLPNYLHSSSDTTVYPEIASGIAGAGIEFAPADTHEAENTIAVDPDAVFNDRKPAAGVVQVQEPQLSDRANSGNNGEANNRVHPTHSGNKERSGLRAAAPYNSLTAVRSNFGITCEDDEVALTEKAQHKQSQNEKLNREIYIFHESSQNGTDNVSEDRRVCVLQNNACVYSRNELLQQLIAMEKDAGIAIRRRVRTTAASTPEQREESNSEDVSLADNKGRTSVRSGRQQQDTTGNVPWQSLQFICESRFNQLSPQQLPQQQRVQIRLHQDDRKTPAQSNLTKTTQVCASFPYPAPARSSEREVSPSPTSSDIVRNSDLKRVGLLTLRANVVNPTAALSDLHVSTQLPSPISAEKEAPYQRQHQQQQIPLQAFAGASRPSRTYAVEDLDTFQRQLIRAAVTLYSPSTSVAFGGISGDVRNTEHNQEQDLLKLQQLQEQLLQLIFLQQQQKQLLASQQQACQKQQHGATETCHPVGAVNRGPRNAVWNRDREMQLQNELQQVNRPANETVGHSAEVNAQFVQQLHQQQQMELEENLRKAYTRHLNAEVHPVLQKAMKLKQLDVATTVEHNLSRAGVKPDSQTYVLLVQVAMSCKNVPLQSQWLLQMLDDGNAIDSRWLDHVLAAAAVCNPSAAAALHTELVKRATLLSPECLSVLEGARCYIWRKASSMRRFTNATANSSTSNCSGPCSPLAVKATETVSTESRCLVAGAPVVAEEGTKKVPSSLRLSPSANSSCNCGGTRGETASNNVSSKMLSNELDTAPTAPVVLEAHTALLAKPETSIFVSTGQERQSHFGGSTAEEKPVAALERRDVEGGAAAGSCQKSKVLNPHAPEFVPLTAARNKAYSFPLPLDRVAVVSKVLCQQQQRQHFPGYHPSRPMYNPVSATEHWSPLPSMRGNHSTVPDTFHNDESTLNSMPLTAMQAGHGEDRKSVDMMTLVAGSDLPFDLCNITKNRCSKNTVPAMAATGRVERTTLLQQKNHLSAASLPHQQPHSQQQQHLYVPECSPPINEREQQSRNMVRQCNFARVQQQQEGRALQQNIERARGNVPSVGRRESTRLIGNNITGTSLRPTVAKEDD